jgi:hypothetical protein
VWGGITIAGREAILGGRHTLPEPGSISLEQ